MEHTPLRTSVCRKSDMRRREWDKRSVRRDVSFEAPAIIRAGGVDTPIAAGHTRYGTEEMDFDPVCVDDCRTVVHGAGDRGGEGSRRARPLGAPGGGQTPGR